MCLHEKVPVLSWRVFLSIRVHFNASSNEVLPMTIPEGAPLRTFAWQRRVLADQLRRMIPAHPVPDPKELTDV